MADTEVEERPVEKSELSAGVKLNAGHPVHLLVGGVKGQGTGTGDDGPTEPPDPTSDGSGAGSGEGGGSTDGDPTSPGGDTGSCFTA